VALTGLTQGRFVSQTYSVVHVGRLVNRGWELLDLDLETSLDVRHDLLVLLSADEADSKALGAEATGSANTVEVLIRLARHVEVDDDIDLLNVDAAAKQVRGHHDAVLTFLEALVDLEPLLLREGAEAGDGRELLTLDDLVQLLGSGLCLRKHDDLVELEVIEQLDQLLGLGLFFELDKVLL